MNEIETVQGQTTIAPEVLLTIARLTTLKIPGVSRMSSTHTGGVNRIIKRSQFAKGVQIDIEDDVVYCDLHVILESDVNIRDVSRIIQYDVARAISKMIGMQVGKVNIHIEDIDYPVELEV
jgi:uncharacterized alkaline shock family protein YloU